MLGGLAKLGQRTAGDVAAFGDFCRFTGRVLGGSVRGGWRWRNVRRILPQMFEIGTRSIPVVMITGAFVGMVLAVQTVMQFKAIGMISRMGTVINLSVLRELGPVLTGVMLAGRVGGGLTAQLGTMRVTEQIDALRAMGADPIRVLVLPRFLACVLVIPLLVVYADAIGILGGYLVSVLVYGVNGREYWLMSAQYVTALDIFYGPLKAVFFGAVLSLIGCYQGFRCGAGAAGVGRACTKAFVASCMAILAVNFFLGMLLNRIEQALGMSKAVF